MFSFLILNFLWNGNLFILENKMNIWFFFLSFFIGLMINLNDKNYFNKLLILSLIFISLFYFFMFNMLFLYIFFEMSLIPIIIMSLMFGMQIEKINSIYYLIFYSFFSSFPFLYMIFYMGNLKMFFIFYKLSYEILLILILMFLVKFPIYFLHYWLPKVHVEASTSASMILAGLLLKFGTQGIYRFMKFMNFYNNFFFFNIMIMGFIIGSLICLFQSDIKSLVAFSSVVHMSFLFFLFINFVNFSKMSSFILMISHGFISTMIFFFVGDFLHLNLSRLIYFFNNYFFNNIFLFMMLNIFFMLNSGFPPNLSFFSEMLGFFMNFNLMKMNFIYIGFFMFFGFLFNFFIIMNLSLGKKKMFNKTMSIFFSMCFLILSFNFLIFL